MSRKTMVASERPNPFATRFVRPGAIDFIPAEDAIRPLSRVAGDCSQEPVWQVVGPHGTGKSTLLRHVFDADHRVHWIQYCGGQPSGATRTRVSWGLGNATMAVSKVSQLVRVLRRHSGETVVCDGFEQIPAWLQRTLLHYARHCRTRLIVTVHQTIDRVPILYRCSQNADITTRLVAGLLIGTEPQTAAWVRAAIDRSHKPIDDQMANPMLNVRELLFDLYDVVQDARDRNGGGHLILSECEKSR